MFNNLLDDFIGSGVAREVMHHQDAAMQKLQTVFICLWPFGLTREPGAPEMILL